MFELEMNGQVYQFKFGMGFLREVNKMTTIPVEKIPGKEMNIGMQYAFGELLDGNVETLCDILYIANKGQNPRLKKEDIDTYIEDENTNIDDVFKQVIDFLKSANATKKITAEVLKMMEEQKKAAELEAAPPQPTSRLAAIPAARRADTCFFIVVSPSLPFGVCRDASDLRPL